MHGQLSEWDRSHSWSASGFILSWVWGRLARGRGESRALGSAIEVTRPGLSHRGCGMLGG